MSGRPDHAAARWAHDADRGVGRSGATPMTGAGPEADAVVEGRGSARAAGAVDEEPEVATGDAVASEVLDDARILSDVAAISAQRDEYLESLQRLKADFDNYRKRVARLQEDQTARAEANLAGKLLPVLDNLDLAWAHLGPRDEGVGVQGGAVSEEARAIAQARGQLLDVLGREGLERVDAVGVPFDPTVHDAVAHTGTSGEGAGVPDAGAGGAGDGAGGASDGGAGDAGAGDGASGGVATPGGVAAQSTVSIDEVLRAGYRWRGQVLRPAMVRVRG